MRRSTLPRRMLPSLLASLPLRSKMKREREREKETEESKLQRQ